MHAGRNPKCTIAGVASLLFNVVPCDRASVVDVSAAHCAPALECVQVRADVLHGLAAAVIVTAHQQAVHLQHDQAQTCQMFAAADSAMTCDHILEAGF